MRYAALCFASCLLLGTLAASAEPESDVERAKQSFKAGATAYAAGDYLAAIQALDAAYQLTPLPAIAFSLGQAERRQYFVDHAPAHLTRAVSLFRRYIEVAPGGSRRADALDALSQLEPLAAALPQPKTGTPVPPRGAEPARQTRLLITTDAPAARLTLDGAPPAPSPLIREVEPGKHHVHVDAVGFFPVERDVMAVAGELVLSQVPLRERPATLSIWTPPDADIYVDGAYVSAGGDGITLELPSGKHRIAVGQKGHRVAVQDLALQRGSTKNIRIELEATPQRLTSEVLFIAGGAALGAALVSSALTIRAEGQAEEFLGRRKLGNVRADDLLRYDSSIIDRDRYRIATGVSLASAAGFFITGLFLHELDQPNPQLLYRTAPRPAEVHSARLQITPLVSEGGLGALVGGSF